MTFLAIDTSAAYTVVVLADDGGAVRASTFFEGRRSLSRRLLAVVDGLLRENSVALENLSAFAVGVGPGSFTGLRVGLTTMKTFAQVSGKPLMGVSTLDAYADSLQADVILTVTPSRRGELYVSVHDRRNPAGNIPPFAESTDDVARRCADLGTRGTLLVCGDPESIRCVDDGGYVRVPQLCAPAESLARLAADRLAAGEIDDPLGLTPLYVVPPAISTPRDASILPGVL